ncbi:ATP-binding protein [Streptomyces sp. S07_1.15]|uniref:ATP-binding protein n=1 Tax=Streptomyces sp. S07_1.15 TaxID=2873925 RepID=UPI001D158FCB|nr:ATP-binding protein [Streptomyces sp. S07_1.15]MCC3650250.1 ATP-binding protein [Streptomyces sp. S07_1.15]
MNSARPHPHPNLPLAAGDTGGTAAAAPAGPVPASGETPRTLREFAMSFTATPRGARLARRLVSHRLHEWGHPYTSRVNETLTLITGELVSNAVRHGRVPGRDFRVVLTEGTGALRVEVTDTRAERVPPQSPAEPPGDAESGRGLLLLSRLADGWGVTRRAGAPGKTVWARLAVGGRGPAE